VPQFVRQHPFQPPLTSQVRVRREFLVHLAGIRRHQAAVQVGDADIQLAEGRSAALEQECTTDLRPKRGQARPRTAISSTAGARVLSALSTGARTNAQSPGVIPFTHWTTFPACNDPAHQIKTAKTPHRIPAASMQQVNSAAFQAGDSIA
jgi:hypothetical protein